MQWETVIGLEIHVQLATRKQDLLRRVDRLRRRAEHAGLRGRPGPARRAAGAERARRCDMAVRFGLAIGAEIGQRSVFERKNYFYPDLPKGYQISQFEHPDRRPRHARDQLDDGRPKDRSASPARTSRRMRASRCTRIFHGMTGIDLNRAGTPLLEIVSEPDMRSAQRGRGLPAQACTRWCATWSICDGNMQEGSLRCDANVSLRPDGRRQARHPHRDQEPQLLPLRREGDRARDRAPDRAARGRRRGACRKPGSTMPTATKPARCAARKKPTTTATSPTRTCCRS